MKHTVLIFGADGQLGADLIQSFSRTHKVVASIKDDVDVTDEHAVRAIIRRSAPFLVINSAALTNVEDNEKKVHDSLNVNAVGALHIARASARHGASILYMSTDYVFDGTKERYVETDMPHPINVYGTSKYTGELLTSLANNRAYIIRTSGLFGAHASGKGYNLVTKMIELAKTGDPIRVVNDQYTCPTYTLDLAQKIHELVIRAVPPGIYHITNQNQCSWYEFALEIFRRAHVNPMVIPITTVQLSSSVRRPLCSVLANRALRQYGMELLPSWKDALTRYLKETNQFHAD